MDDGQILAALYVCRQEARRWRRLPVEGEELEAEAVLGLVKAAGRYDPSKGTPFPAFARPFIRGALLDLVRRDARRDSMRDGTFAEFVPLDRSIGQNEDMSFELIDPRILEEIVEARDILRLVAGLPEQERIALIRTQVDGVPAKEVAEELDVSLDTVYRLVSWGSQRLKIRLEKRAAA